jgi:hypothetical protein
VIRLFGSLIMLAITASGYMFFDYKMSAKWAGREDAEGLTFTEYLSGLTGRIAGLTSASAADGLPSNLADMLPKPPDGWSVRPVAAADIEQFLPKSTRKADKKGVAAVKAMSQAEGGKGTEVAAFAYEKGDRTVLIRAVRYPNIIFTSFMAMQQRFELQMMTAEFRGTEFMTVRGLDVTEDLLPEGFRGRMFMADVGAQIHIRVLAPKRMKDADLVPFFETLHVEAMNASVIDKVEGLGKVPVIVLASAMDQTQRDAYLADIAAREAEADARNESERKAAEAENAAEAEETAKTVKPKDGASIFGGLKDALFGEDASEMSVEERKGHEAALLEAAESGDAAAAALHAGALYGAIAEELTKTEMKAASSGSTGGFTLGAKSSGSKSSIKVGVGKCVKEAGGKFCAVDGASSED